MLRYYLRVFRGAYLNCRDDGKGRAKSLASASMITLILTPIIFMDYRSD